MKKTEITFKEEDITIEDAKNILDVYFDTKDENYKKWMKEITPFKWYDFRNYFFKFISYFSLKKQLKSIKNSFTYKLAFISEIDKSDNDWIYIKWVIDWKIKLFFKINKRQLEKWKNIFIDKMISLEKGLWKFSIIELCKHYNINKIIVEPSIYWMSFWQKISKELKWEINITIRTIYE